MTTLRALIARNCKVFFKDKGLFLPSLIAPLILLFLFVAFLGNVYRDSIRSIVEGLEVSDSLVESVAAGWLLSTLLSVCAVTIAFTANTIMVQDKVMGQHSDILVSPVPRSTVALAYFLATYLSTLLFCLVALGAGFIYIGAAGWHLTAADLFLTLLDTLLLVFFGTAFSSLVCGFLHSQGAIAGVQAIVSSAYGFLCGAYMPLSSLTEWLRNLLMFLPGTYGTGLLHAHLMNGAIEEITQGIPELAQGMKEGFDCILFFFDSEVPLYSCYLAIGIVTLLFVGLYVFLCAFRHRRKH